MSAKIYLLADGTDPDPSSPEHPAALPVTRADMLPSSYVGRLSSLQKDCSGEFSDPSRRIPSFRRANIFKSSRRVNAKIKVGPLRAEYVLWDCCAFCMLSF